MTNPLSTYNTARAEYDRLNGLFTAGIADWANANPEPAGSDRFTPAMDAWLDRWATASEDISADLGVSAAFDRLVAAEHGLIGWMHISVADQINDHTEAAEIHRLFDLMNNGPAALRIRTRRRLLDLALRFARGRLSG